MTGPFRSAWRVLTFRPTRDELLALDDRHLAFGLTCTWLVGMGRYRDDPRAHLLQKLGVGSVVYVFVLSLVLFLVMRPLRPPDWSYRRLLTFVTLLSPPAALYAIPVERFMSLGAANAANAMFLGAIALWRVALLFFYQARFARFNFIQVLVTGLLPLAAIVTTLFVLNLEHVTFNIMGGIRNPSLNDAAYNVLFLLTLLSELALLPLVLAYIVLIVLAWREKRQRQTPDSQQKAA